MSVRIWAWHGLLAMRQMIGPPGTTSGSSHIGAWTASRGGPVARMCHRKVPSSDLTTAAYVAGAVPTPECSEQRLPSPIEPTPYLPAYDAAHFALAELQALAAPPDRHGDDGGSRRNERFGSTSPDRRRPCTVWLPLRMLNRPPRAVSSTCLNGAAEALAIRRRTRPSDRWLALNHGPS
jgi:hypothetical protein